jgi:hypothetical protein
MSLALKRRVTVLATAITVLLIAGVVSAAWLSSGSGDGTATATEQIDDVLLTSEAVTGYYPGLQRTHEISVPNGNAYDLAVAAFTLDTVVISNDSDGADPCSPADIVVTLPEPETDGYVAQAGGGAVINPTGDGVYEYTVKMIDDAANGCQGASFTLPITASLVSAVDTSGE